MEFRVDLFDAQATLAKAEKIASRSQKKNLTGGWKVALETRVETSEAGIPSEYTYLVVTGTPCAYAGWEFIGVADFLEGEVFTRTVPGAVEYKVTENYCAHCKTNRGRNHLLVVRNVETNEIKQVGSTCVKDFLGWDFTLTALPTEEEFESLNKGSKGSSGVEINTFLAWVVATANVYGFVTAAAAGGYGSTGQLVWGGLRGDKEAMKVLVEPTDADRVEASALVEFGKTFEGDSGYAENLRTASGLAFVYEQTKGIVASAYKVQQNASAREVEEAKVFKAEQVAPTGAKVQLEVEVVGVTGFEGFYGYIRLFQFVSGDYKLKWFCSGNADLEVGGTYTIKGTVKGSNLYNGQFSTILTRCKVV